MQLGLISLGFVLRDDLEGLLHLLLLLLDGHPEQVQAVLKVLLHVHARNPVRQMLVPSAL